MGDKKIVQIVMIDQDDQVYAGQFLVLYDNGQIGLLDVGTADNGTPAAQVTMVPVTLA